MLFAGVAFLLPDQVVGTLLKLQYFQSLGFQSSLVRCHLVAFFFFSSLLAWWDRRCFPFFVSQWYSSSYSFFDAGKITFIPALGALLTGKVSLKVMPGVFGSNHAVVGHFLPQCCSNFRPAHCTLWDSLCSIRNPIFQRQWLIQAKVHSKDAQQYVKLGSPQDSSTREQSFEIMK